MGLVVAVQDGYAPLFTWERWQGASIQMVTALVRPSAQGTGVRIKTSDSSMETSVPGLGTRLQESMVAGGVR